MIDFPFLFLALIRLHSYTAFIRERHSAGMRHRRARAPASRRGAGSPLSAAEAAPGRDRRAPELARLQGAGLVPPEEGGRESSRSGAPPRRAVEDF